MGTGHQHRVHSKIQFLDGFCISYLLHFEQAVRIKIVVSSYVRFNG